MDPTQNYPSSVPLKAFSDALIDKYRMPREKVDEFISLLRNDRLRPSSMEIESFAGTLGFHIQIYERSRNRPNLETIQLLYNHGFETNQIFDLGPNPNQQYIDSRSRTPRKQDSTGSNTDIKFPTYIEVYYSYRTPGIFAPSILINKCGDESSIKIHAPSIYVAGGEKANIDAYSPVIIHGSASELSAIVREPSEIHLNTGSAQLQIHSELDIEVIPSTGKINGVWHSETLEMRALKEPKGKVKIWGSTRDVTITQGTLYFRTLFSRFFG